MVNGYVNIPNELTDLSSLREEGRFIPGIYKKMKDILALNKPIIGKFMIDNLEAVFSPVCITFDNSIILIFTYGYELIRVTIGENDSTAVSVIDG